MINDSLDGHRSRSTTTFDVYFWAETGEMGHVSFPGDVRHLKLVADEGNCDCQCLYGSHLSECFKVSEDLRAAAHDLKLSADQSVACGHVDVLKDSEGTTEFSASIERLKETM
jgi:hypothetical protein